jgi:hypothetical protein
MKSTFTLALLFIALTKNVSHSQPLVSPTYSPLPYIVVSQPNSNIKGTTAAIIPTQRNIKETKAASLAAFARRRSMSKLSKQNQLHIFVFNNKRAAQLFAEYQSKRQKQLLRSRDYIKLIHLWPHALVCYSYAYGKETLKYPHKNPKAWWATKSG